MPTNIRLGCKVFTATNTLAYYDGDLIKVVKCFIAQAPLVGVRGEGVSKDSTSLKGQISEAGLLNKSSCLAPALGVTKYTNVIDIISAALVYYLSWTWMFTFRCFY